MTVVFIYQWNLQSDNWRIADTWTTHTIDLIARISIEKSWESLKKSDNMSYHTFDKMILAIGREKNGLLSLSRQLTRLVQFHFSNDPRPLNPDNKFHLSVWLVSPRGPSPKRGRLKWLSETRRFHQRFTVISEVWSWKLQHTGLPSMWDTKTKLFPIFLRV